MMPKEKCNPVEFACSTEIGSFFFEVSIVDLIVNCHLSKA